MTKEHCMLKAKILQEEGKTQREIAQALGISASDRSRNGRCPKRRDLLRRRWTGSFRGGRRMRGIGLRLPGSIVF